MPVVVKRMMSSPAVAFASKIAWRSEPGPESAVMVTVKVAAWVLASARPKAAANRALNFIRAYLGILIVGIES